MKGGPNRLVPTSSNCRLLEIRIIVVCDGDSVGRRIVAVKPGARFLPTVADLVRRSLADLVGRHFLPIVETGFSLSAMAIQFDAG